MEEITENLYFQHFIVPSDYQTKATFVPSRLVEFHKHLIEDILSEINEKTITYNTSADSFPVEAVPEAWKNSGYCKEHGIR